VEQFLAAVAAPTPTPGGGSVSALAGALSVALSRMVAGLARGKAGYEGVESELAQIEARGKIIQARLEALVDEDARAYDAVIVAMRMPKSSQSEKTARVDAMQAAYRKATEVPLETMERCVEALELAEAAAKKGNRGATTDAAVAVLLAESAIRGASLNCAVNLASIRDERFRSTAEERVEQLLKRSDEIGHEAMAIVTERL
jgi:formiminotetrahydrofolate cyclodeaminase